MDVLQFALIGIQAKNYADTGQVVNRNVTKEKMSCHGKSETSQYNTIPVTSGLVLNVMMNDQNCEHDLRSFQKAFY